MIPYSCQSINQEDIDAVIAALQSTYLTQGKEVELFEEEIAEYIGVAHAITFNSATSALLAAYTAIGINEGDEVISSPLSFVATSNMFVTLGAVPKWCDIRLDGNMDESKVEALITPKTKAIVPIDFAGKPVAIEYLKKLAKKHNLYLIEDAAHAFGSSLHTQKVGSFSSMSIFSFHAIKPLTTAEGGCVVTNDTHLAAKLKLFRSHGIVKKKFWNSDMQSMGHNFRMSELAAALGRSQLKRVDQFIQKRNEIASYYDQVFASHKLVSTVPMSAEQISSRHLYALLLDPALHCVKEEIFQALQKNGLGVQVHYKPIYQNSYYEKRFGRERLQVCEDFYRSEISIPCHQDLTLEDAKKIAQIILEVLEIYSYRSSCF